MTNLQESREQRDAGLAPEMLRRLWFWGPIGAGGALAGLLLATTALPLFLAINRDQQRLSELGQRREEANLLRLKKQRVEKERLAAENQRQQLISLVSGKGDGSTYLATLDLEARQTGVKLQLFEPEGPAAPGSPGTPGAPGAANAPGRAGAPPPPPGQGGKEQGPPPDPLVQAGLQGRPLLLSARGTYPQLLAFLRRMELLDLLVEQKDLTLSVAGSEPGRPGGNEKDLPLAVPEVELKLGMTVYSRAKQPGQKG